MCAGIKPNISLAEEAGIRSNIGLVVDDHIQTSEAYIYAAGDVAEHQGRIYDLWPIAIQQAEVAAVIAMGGRKTFSGAVRVTCLKVVGIDLTGLIIVSARHSDY